MPFRRTNPAHRSLEGALRPSSARRNHHISVVAIEETMTAPTTRQVLSLQALSLQVVLPLQVLLDPPQL
jgi:hypothetical protein